jgi:hypothetical protein
MSNGMGTYFLLAMASRWSCDHSCDIEHRELPNRRALQNGGGCHQSTNANFSFRSIFSRTCYVPSDEMMAPRDETALAVRRRQKIAKLAINGAITL